MLSWVRSLFLNNVLAKLGCLILAVVLWSWVMVEGTAEERIETVPVQVQGLPGDVELAPGTRPTVTLRLEGSSLRSLSPKDVSITIQPDQIDIPRTRYELSAADVDLPSGWDLKAIEPRIIALDFRRVEEQEFELIPNVSDRPDTYEVEARVIPTTARVRGPQEHMINLQSLRLESVSLQGITPPGDDFQLQARVPSGLELVEPETNQFQLRVDVYEQVNRHEIDNVPVNVTDVPEGFRAEVEPATLTVVVKGPRERIRDIGPEQIDILVPAPSVDVRRSIELARIELPEQLELADGFSRQQPVQVRLEENSSDDETTADTQTTSGVTTNQ